MTVKVFALAASMLLSMATLASDVPAPLKAAKKQVETADYRLTGHLVCVDEKGIRTSYGINIRAHWFPGVLRILLEIASPKDARFHALLEMRPGGESVIQVVHPGDAKATPLAFEKWAEGPLGSGFSFEDFLEAPYFWPSQSVLPKTKYGARNCDLLVSTPGAADRTHYAQVKSWLDADSSFPVYVEKTMKNTGVVKEFTYLGLSQRQDTWYASQVVAKIRGRAGSTLLIIDNGSARAHLDLKDFSPAQLTHF